MKFLVLLATLSLSTFSFAQGGDTATSTAPAASDAKATEFVLNKPCAKQTKGKKELEACRQFKKEHKTAKVSK